LPLPYFAVLAAQGGEDLDFDDRGNLLAFLAGAIHRVPYGGKPELLFPAVAMDGRGLRFVDGEIFLASKNTNEIVRVDRQGIPSRLLDMRKPNALALGPGRRLYALNYLECGVTMIDLRTRTASVAAPAWKAMGNCNGLAFSPDLKRAYFTDYSGRLYVMSVAVDGTMGRPEVLLMGLPGAPDGMVADECGNLYISGHDAGPVVRVLIGGLKVEPLAPDLRGTSVAFGSGLGGWDRRSLFVTTLDGRNRIFEVRLGVAGAPAP
jgi:hypothetical protein